jgi:hypothetical protein
MNLTSYEGLYQFKYLSFELCDAVAIFERLMEFVLRGLHWKTCILYTDDIIVFADEFESHISRLDVVLDRLSNANLKVAPKKCHFFQKQVKFLGHLVSGEGISTDPAKVDSVRNWPLSKQFMTLGVSWVPVSIIAGSYLHFQTLPDLLIS